jgi:hypothetical protein
MGNKAETKTEVREFTRPLDDEELARKATEMADLIIQHASDKKTAEDESKERREELKALAERVALLAREVKEGKQIHQVDCYWRPNYVDKTMDLVREDTGEVTESRDMTEDEKTGDLFAHGGEPAGDEDKDEEDGGGDLI